MNHALLSFYVYRYESHPVFRITITYEFHVYALGQILSMCVYLNLYADTNRDEDPVMAKIRIRGCVPQTKEDF